MLLDIKAETKKYEYKEKALKTFSGQNSGNDRILGIWYFTRISVIEHSLLLYA